MISPLVPVLDSAAIDVGWLILRLTIFTATIALAAHGVRLEFAAASGDIRGVTRIWSLLAETAAGFFLVVLGPEIVGALARIAMNRPPVDMTSLGQIPLLGDGMVQVDYILAAFAVPLGLFLCDLMLIILGLRTIFSSVTGNIRSQSTILPGVVRVGMAVVVLSVLPWLLPTVALFFLQLAHLMGVPIPA